MFALNGIQSSDLHSNLIDFFLYDWCSGSNELTVVHFRLLIKAPTKNLIFYKFVLCLLRVP